MFEFKHPKYYKNLRKLYRSRNRDGAISLQAGTPDARRTPRTGQSKSELKLDHSNWGLPRVIGSQARERASAQASSGARINKR